jgi:hypothetical protein
MFCIGGLRIIARESDSKAAELAAGRGSDSDWASRRRPWPSFKDYFLTIQSSTVRIESGTIARSKGEDVFGVIA